MDIIKNGTVLCADGVFRRLDIGLEQGIIVALGERLDGAVLADATDCLVTPGLIDIHTHGAMGEDASDGTEAGLRTIARHQAANGVTGFLATTMTLPEAELTAAATVVAAVAPDRRADEARVLGIHMEGPFFDHSRRGAQNEAYLALPDAALFARVNAASGGRIRIADVAPELPGGLDFVRAVCTVCRVSLAHTDADYDTASAAFAAGASHVTHLFNAMPHFIHRAPGVIGAAADYAAFVEMISDGVHLHPSTVRAVFRLFGRDRVCLISDSMRGTGMKPGIYNLGGQDITVTADRALMQDGTIAGSVTPVSECVRRAVSFGIPMEAALMAATHNPARAIGLDETLGTIEEGKRADLVLWTPTLALRTVLVDGVPTHAEA